MNKIDRLRKEVELQKENLRLARERKDEVGERRALKALQKAQLDLEQALLD